VDLNWRTEVPGVGTLGTVGWRLAETLDIGRLAELQKRLQFGAHPIGGWRSVTMKKEKLHLESC
jgi:hypothetical protein